jgi:Ca2+-binding RTX toxin-like protein
MARKIQNSGSNNGGFQILETRTHLSVSLEDGVLMIEGGNANDVAIVSQSRSTISVRFNGERERFDAGEVESIEFRGGTGNDRLSVNSKVTVPVLAYGGSGNDKLDGGSGDDRLFGENGNDSLTGSEGNDFLIGNDGDDKLWGNAGDDQLSPGVGADVVEGGSGNDRITASNDGVRDRIDGGAGNDRVLGSDPQDRTKRVEFFN